MNGYNFTERVRKVLALAREEGMRLGNEHVAPEHILLGLVREGEGVAAAVLLTFGVDFDDLRRRIEPALSPAREVDRRIPDLPYTSTAKKVLEVSMHEARQLKHSYVGTEHLLLGLLRVESRVTEVLTTQMGVTAENARAEILRLLGTDVSTAERARPSPHEESALELEIRVRFPDGRIVEHRCRGKADALRLIRLL